MDCYFGNVMEDVVVPKGQEEADRLPSLESWLKWELTDFEPFNKCFTTDANLNEELRFNGKLCSDYEFELSANVKNPSCYSSICGGLSDEHLNQASHSRPQPDYQLDDFARFVQIDHIFLNSIRGDLPGTEDPQNLFCFSPKYQCGRMPGDYHLTDVSSDHQSISNNEHGLESGKYLKTQAFSPSMNLEKDIHALHFIPCKSEVKNSLTMKKAPLAKVLVPPEQRSAYEFVSESVSLEESVLQELEMVMAQLSDKARICFRDAFYRLAKNSEENPVALNKHGNVHVRTHSPKWTISEEKVRSAKKETTELETNAIDRTIANLTFNKMEINIGDFPAATAVANSKPMSLK